MSLTIYLEKLSAKVLAETSVIRSTFENTTNKGTGFEVVLRNLIEAYTPATNLVTHGEIIDTYGNQSGQIDIVIVQDFHPRGFEDGRPNIILYDFTIAIGEAKTKLDTTQLASTVKSSLIFDSFKRHIDNNNILSGEFYENDNTKPPPYFLIALTTDVAYNTIAAAIEKSNISLVIALEHSTYNKGVIALGKTHRTAEVISFIDKIGERKSDYVWEADNPILGMIWGLNKFYVPYANLTNVFPSYLE
jgi:hypothetical protein